MSQNTSAAGFCSSAHGGGNGCCQHEPSAALSGASLHSSLVFTTQTAARIFGFCLDYTARNLSSAAADAKADDENRFN